MGILVQNSRSGAGRRDVERSTLNPKLLNSKHLNRSGLQGVRLPDLGVSFKRFGIAALGV